MANMLREMNRDWHGISPEEERIPRMRSQMFEHLMIGYPFRDYVAKFIKEPLMLAITKAKTLSEIITTLKTSARRIPIALTRNNCKNSNVLALFDIEAKFFKYEVNDAREDMFRSAFKMYKSVKASDPYYDNRDEWLLEQKILKILEGKWQPRKEGNPWHNWNEPKPYGGEHSIVYKMQQHREEIKKLLGV